MVTRLNPYISFGDSAREAMTFYQRALGGSLEMHTFGEYGAANEPYADLVMHAMLQTEDGLVLMASDSPPGMSRTVGNNITISLSGDDEALLRERFEKLAEGGSVDVPLEKQMWGDVFGQLTDRFGIGWLVDIAETA
ncbi:MAG TPA: VOC family protein [Marmoricola sp.]|nr:VOC family protein [Marmoricola sp.]